MKTAPFLQFEQPLRKKVDQTRSGTGGHMGHMVAEQVGAYFTSFSPGWNKDRGKKIALLWKLLARGKVHCTQQIWERFLTIIGKD